MMQNNQGILAQGFLAQCRLAVVSTALLLSSTAFAQGAIQSVAGSLQDGSEVLRIELSQPLANPPTGFAIQSPARIALDFRTRKTRPASRWSSSIRAISNR